MFVNAMFVSLAFVSWDLGTDVFVCMKSNSEPWLRAYWLFSEMKKQTMEKSLNIIFVPETFQSLY